MVAAYVVATSPARRSEPGPPPPRDRASSGQPRRSPHRERVIGSDAASGEAIERPSRPGFPVVECDVSVEPPDHRAALAPGMGGSLERQNLRFRQALGDPIIRTVADVAIANLKLDEVGFD